MNLGRESVAVWVKVSLTVGRVADRERQVESVIAIAAGRALWSSVVGRLAATDPRIPINDDQSASPSTVRY